MFTWRLHEDDTQCDITEQNGHGCGCMKQNLNSSQRLRVQQQAPYNTWKQHMESIACAQAGDVSPEFSTSCCHTNSACPHTPGYLLHRMCRCALGVCDAPDSLVHVSVKRVAEMKGKSIAQIRSSFLVSNTTESRKAGLKVFGESLYTARALRYFQDYVPPEEPPGTPLGDALRIRQPKVPQLKKVANYLPSCRQSRSADPQHPQPEV